ncbi:helix-turn-helix domain-containing protein [uncultured Roseibium sp.]|uniref:helix-turn-helix domain-containing protein n=1 Tax=uncultured Roseibium sp. TaxID=1936171 RepID=UPI002595F80B|nr:helix-turn-helix domain-containing protein [uncultured Roseibium sp.]
MKKLRKPNQAQNLEQATETNGRWSRTPALAYSDPRLSWRDLTVLGALGIYADRSGHCFRSQVRLARMLGMGRATLQRAITSLVASGWLKKFPRKHPNGADRSHAYQIIYDHDPATQGIELRRDKEPRPGPEHDTDGLPAGHRAYLEAIEDGALDIPSIDPSNHFEKPFKANTVEATDTQQAFTRSPLPSPSAVPPADTGFAKLSFQTEWFGYLREAVALLNELGLNVRDWGPEHGFNQIRNWYDQQYDLEKLVRPIVQKVSRRAPDPIFSLKYFEAELLAEYMRRIVGK